MTYEEKREPRLQISQLLSDAGLNQKTITVHWTINLPMEFPEDWDKHMIEFHLNDSSWCCSNLIEMLEEYDKEHGCICGICRAEVKE